MLWRVSVCVCLHFMCSSVRAAPIFVYNPTLGLHMQAPLRNRMTPKANRSSGRYAPGFGAALRDISVPAVGLRPMPRLMPRTRCIRRTSIDFVFSQPANNEE